MARASGAMDVLQSARVVETLPEAIKACVFISGASARCRTLNWPTLLPRECAQKFQELSPTGVVAAVFGPEKSGLSNTDLDHCDALLTIPTNPDFSSLNLAPAVQVGAYELFKVSAAGDFQMRGEKPATVADREGLYQHLERAAVESDFFDPASGSKLPTRLRRLFSRVPDLEREEVNILRGLLNALQEPKPK